MLISKQWLSDYVDLPDSVSGEDLGLQLTMSTVEVEGVEKQGESLDGVVVGEILEIKKHPDADKLSVAQVDVGEEKPRQIVFGQMVEMEVGFKVPVALAPTKLPGGNKIKKSKLRGVMSEGMLCLDKEMGLAEEGISIRFFDKDIKSGTSIIEVLDLNDIVFDIDNKSMTHRPDLWGHYGMAREVAALQRKKLKEYKPKEVKEGKGMKIEIDIQDKELCKRYMSVALDGIKVGPSPEWMQKRLLAVGLRPINNMVDITNYVLFDLGQPMHAFDAKDLAIKDNKLKFIVRRAKDGEKFTTLDDKEHELAPEILMVCDEEKAVDIGGVMGGQNSEISNDTTTVVFEAANFDATNIRKTSTNLGIRTDSSTRFEKSPDPYNPELAIKRAVELTLEICPDAKVISNVADEGDWKKKQIVIDFDLEFLNKRMGIELEKKMVVDILERLGFEIKKDKAGVLMVGVPTWRATKDISIQEDLVEEVARVYGYGNIEVELPKFPITPPKRNDLRILERKIKDALAMKYGFTETYNYSFVSPESIERLGLDVNNHIELENPIAKDRPYVRTTLLSNLLENVEKNTHKFDSLRLFEVGKVFDKNTPGVRAEAKKDDLLPRQDLMLALAYSSKNDKIPFYEVSSVVSNLLNELGVDCELKVDVVSDKYIHPSRQVKILASKEEVGFIAELHPQVQTEFGIDERVGLVEINLNNLVKYIADKTDYEPLPLYPEIKRDIAFTVDKQVLHGSIAEAISQVDDLIQQVELFDVYEGEKLGKDKKSLAYHIIYRSDEKTLEAKDVDKVHDKVVKVLEKEFKAEVRK